ncbi:nucleolar protein 8-like [Saccostrea echinata]|uniref:nucleolar protein 8-like n=1 Tax=Saccostrea echinata TaxID=191078 RepID=UPI002A806AD1|nr:nucleolar protein 8-like [Saccostrea echinata]
MKRVFVGGLFPGVTEEEIRDRFSRFGEVTEVEIKRKKNGEDSSEKIFAYVNLNISEENLSKCFSVYNKTKWRGSQLKLQLAKEDFLKRLGKERENGFAVEPKVKCKKAIHHDPLRNQEGIQNFHMRGAVPGTSIQGEENWVVGKYGRVLPIVHIPSKHSKKIMTIDPSKFCHNVKRVKEEEQELDNCDTKKLTWALKEKNPEKMKKRIGDVRSTSKFAGRKYHQTSVSAEDLTQRLNGVTGEEDDLEIVPLKESTGSAKLGACADGDSDSDYEAIKNSVTKDKGRVSSSETERSSKEKNTEKGSKNVKLSERFTETTSKKNNSSKIVHDSEKSAGASSCVVNFMEDDSDKESVSSADTDVIVAKQPNRNSGKTSIQSTSYSVTQGINEFSDGLTVEESRSESSNFNYESDDSLSAVGYERLAKRIEKEYQRKFNSDMTNNEGNLDFEVTGTSLKNSSPDKQKILLVTGNIKAKRTMKTELVSERSTNNDSVQNNSVSNSDDDSVQVSYEETFSLSASEGSWEDDRLKEDTAGTENIAKKFKSSSGQTGPKCVLPPFKGTSSLYSSDVGKNQGSMCNRNDVEDSPTEKETKTKKVITSPSKGTVMVDSSIKNTKNSIEKNETKTQDGKLIKNKKATENFVQSHSLEEGVKKCESEVTADVDIKQRSQASDRKRVESMMETKETEVTANVDVKQRSKASDRKRVESMMERTKEAEMKKRAIQQALKLNSKEERPNKKIVFESDSSDAEDKQMEEGGDRVQTANKTNTEREKKPALFDSSSEEASDEDSDKERFRIRPEFEGKAGKKLMKLQSRFKNDERFKLDEKFIDETDSEKNGSSDEEDERFKPPTENDDEKSRALKILEEVVGSKALKKVQKKKTMFKDVSAIHFDPTKEDHKQFEMEPQMKKKKIKAVQRKTSFSSDEDTEAVDPDRHKEPIEEVPEVTKERFYQVASDSFKETFSNKTSDVVDSQFSLLSVFGRQQQQTADSDEEMPEVEQIESNSSQKAGQLLWKQHVDSSHENMTSDEEAETNVPVNLFTSSQSTFFFTEDDERIKEGIQEFCRKEDLETIREKWLENRQNLVNAYTTKHKSLSRKKRIAQKNKRRK